MSTLVQRIFNVYLVVNPKRELEFKMAITVGLQDISSMYITLENPYIYILYDYYLRIKLTGSLVMEGTMAATTITRVYAGKIQSA